jgi:hypothetical protein
MGLWPSWRRSLGEWDRYDERNTHGMMILVHARDQLAGETPPWVLDATRRDLELLLTRLPAGSIRELSTHGELLAQGTINTKEIPKGGDESADQLLDVMVVCEALRKRLHDASG